MDATQHQLSRSSVTEEEVLDVVMTGDETQIAAWVDFSLPLAKPSENTSEHASIINPDVERVLVRVLKRCPPSTRRLFRAALARKGVHLHSGDVNEVWDAVLKGDLLSVKHWVRSLPLHGVSLDAYARLVRKPTSELSDAFITQLVSVSARATPAMKELLLDELCRRGIIMPEDRPTPLDDDFFQALEAPELDSDDTPFRAPRAYDFTRLVARLARVGMLFRPRPERASTAIYDALLPFGRFSPLHYFVVNYLTSFEMHAVLEAYSAWYDIRFVSAGKFRRAREDVLQPTLSQVRRLFRTGQAGAALAAGCFFTPPGYESDTDRVPRGTFHQVDRQLFMSALLRFEYVTPLLTRIDVKDLAPTYAVVERRVADLAELLLALQISDLPQAQRSHGLFRVVENLQGCKSDATLFSYVFSHTDVNPDAFFNKSPWPPRLDEDISPEQLAQRNAEQRALAILRDWLRHRSPVSAAHYTLANVCPHNVPVWDALAALTIRVALANFQPSAPPKYEFDAEADEFERLHRGPPVEQEIVNTALSYLDMITSQDTVDTVTLSLYLDAAECFARFHPDIFGPKRLMHQLDKAFIAGRTLRKDLRRPLKYLAEQPELISIKQLPNPIRKLFTGLGLVYSKDTTSNKEKKAVLRLLTSFFMLYGVAFSSNLSNTWKRVEGAPTATLMRWMLGMSGVLRMPPEALGQQLAYSNGLFIERPEVLQHLLLLIGPESSLLPAFREHGDDHTSPVWDKTTQFLAHMPANIDLPRPGVSQGRWLGNEMLAHALRSIDGDVPFDSALPALALEQGARRQDCFMACMLAHEAAFERLENRHRDADRVIAIGAEAPAGPEFEWFDIEKTMLRLAGRHSYVILKLALDLFYPKSAVAKLTSALLALRAGRYFDARHDFLQVVPVLTAGGRDMPSGFHVREQRPKWTEEMVEEMMRSAFGVECEMPAPSAHDRHWLKELFSNLEFKSGLDVLAELEDSFKPKRSGAPEPDFLSSEKIYDEKLAEFREFIAPDMFLWEHRWERERFAAEAYEQFGEAGASPVVTGAIFFSMWDHFKYQETRVPLDEFSPEEEVQLLFTAVQQWEKCDQEVYGEVVFTLRARIYTLMLAHNLDGLRVTVGESRIELKTQAFFPHSRLPAPKPDENTKAVAAAAAAVNAEPARAPDFVFKDEYTAEQRAGALDDADYLDALPESADPNDVGRPIPSEGGDGGAPGSSSDEDEDESKAHEEEDGATPRAAPDFAAEIEKEMARAAAEEAAAQRELEAGFVSGRMDIAGFMVYQSLKPHHYMPEAALWERRWDQQAEIEKHASLSATPLEQLQDRLAAAGVERAGKDESGRPLDTRVLDVELFIEVMDRLLYNAQFQLAFLLAQDVRAYYPLIFSNLLPDLEKHLHRVRLVFYVSGIDKLKSSDLGLAPPLPPGPGKRAKWRKPKVSKAADFANIPWLPTDAKNDYVLVSRRRMSWNSTTKIDPIRYLLISLFPRIDPTQVQAAMTGDKKSGKSLNAQAVLRTFAKEEPELARVAELFITALMIHDAEQRHSDTSLARTLAAMVEVQNDGTLPLMIRIAEALDNSSVLSILTMHPSMVVHELMRNQNDFRLIRQYLRAAVPDDSSPNAVKYLKEAYVFFLEQRVEEEVRALEEAELEAKRAAISLKGEAWKARQREIKAQSERRAREGLEAGWSRNRLIAFAACVGERRQMHDLGQAFLDVARSVDISAHADMRGLGSVQALQILKMELFYAAYFAFFASSHLSGMQATLREIDDTLLRLRGSPSRFRLFAQRTLFLTGEYRALRRSIGHVVQEQRSAKLRKKIRAKAQKKLDQDLRAIRAKRKQLKAAMRAERAAMGDLPSDDDSSDEELADDLPEPDLEQSPAELEFAQQHAQAIEETVRDDEEVELASKRDALVLGLLRTLQNLQGYQLFSELEKIAASFKDLAEEFAEHNWYRQSLDCHYISELVHVEMEYIPAKLRRMNFVDPDEYEFNQIWRHYSTCLPLKVLLERQDRERAAAERAGGGGGEGGEGGEGGGGGAAVPRGKSVRLLSLQGPSRRELVGAGGEGDPYDMDPVDNPDQLSPEQLEVLIGDCILSGVQGRFLERERREFAVEAKRLEAEGKAPGRVYKHLHNLIARTVDQFMQLLDGSPLLPDELRDIIVAQGEEMLEFDSSRDHGADDTHVEERKYPSTVLFIMRDRFGKWSLGVGPTNLTAAQQSLRILSHLNKADQVSLFRDFYFSNQYA